MESKFITTALCIQLLLNRTTLNRVYECNQFNLNTENWITDVLSVASNFQLGCIKFPLFNCNGNRMKRYHISWFTDSTNAGKVPPKTTPTTFDETRQFFVFQTQTTENICYSMMMMMEVDKQAWISIKRFDSMHVKMLLHGIDFSFLVAVLRLMHLNNSFESNNSRSTWREEENRAKLRFPSGSFTRL